MPETDLKSMMKLEKEERTLFSYHGPFFIELLSVFGNYVKFITRKYPAARTKLFKVFIELSQNVANYSEESLEIKSANDIGKGRLYLKEYEDHFLFTTINLVRKEHAAILKDRCDTINESNQEELRQIKREMRISSPGEKYGARIGLIQASLLSKNALTYKLENLDNGLSYFSISVRIDKK